MKQLCSCMFRFNMLFYISLPSGPNINILRTVVDRERFSMFRTDYWVLKSGHICRAV